MILGAPISENVFGTSNPINLEYRWDKHEDVTGDGQNNSTRTMLELYLFDTERMETSQGKQVVIPKTTKVTSRCCTVHMQKSD